jgi:DNA-binding response OmpR family regulator
MEQAAESKLRKVVSIEDDETMIDLFRLILESNGFKVYGALSGQEGLALIEDEKPDVVLLDIMMPGMDGWQVYQQMRGSTTMSNIPVIMVTAKAQPIDKLLAEKIAKVDAYIVKPFSPRELKQHIEDVLKQAKTLIS